MFKLFRPLCYLSVLLSAVFLEYGPPYMDINLKHLLDHGCRCLASLVCSDPYIKPLVAYQLLVFIGLLQGSVLP